MNKLNRFVVAAFVFCSLSSNAQIGTGGFKIDENGDPLPQVLLNFDAIFDNTKVELTWSSILKTTITFLLSKNRKML